MQSSSHSSNHSSNSFRTSLDDLELLEVSGADSEKFLQGQLTCDLNDLADDHITLGALCNNKGRIYASFRLLRHGGAFYISLQPGVMANTRQILQKYIPFYKATMADAGPRFQRVGLAGPAARDALARVLPSLPEPGHALSAGNDLVLNIGAQSPRFEIWSTDRDIGLASAITALDAGTPADWMAIDVAAGIFFVSPEAVGLYTPEETNLDLAGFVSFDKGCYTGQEIVARMHYRGKAGKRMHAVAFSAGATVVDSALKTSSGKILGNVFNVVYLSETSLGSVVLKTDTDLTQPMTLDTVLGAVPVSVSEYRYD